MHINRKLAQWFGIVFFALSLSACGGGGSYSADNESFKIKIRTTLPGTSADNAFEIPTSGIGYNYNVDCDSDGINEAVTAIGNYVCIYDTPGDYTVSISRSFSTNLFQQYWRQRETTFH